MENDFEINVKKYNYVMPKPKITEIRRRLKVFQLKVFRLNVFGLKVLP